MTTVQGLSLHIASDRTWTWNLWFLSARCYPLSFIETLIEALQPNTFPENILAKMLHKQLRVHELFKVLLMS